MGKKLVTEDDLLSGVGGGFGTISQMGAGRPIRDNPFRDTRSEPVPAVPPKVATATESMAPAEEQQSAAPVTPRALPSVTRPAVPPARDNPPPVVAPRASAKSRVPQRVRKTDTYSEKMSTFLSPDMRDELEMTARMLQRNRLVKGESITVHTLIRSGVRVMTELLQFTDGDVINSEEELYALVKRKLGV